LRSSCRLPR
jgi:sugar phosphate permease